MQARCSPTGHLGDTAGHEPELLTSPGCSSQPQVYPEAKSTVGWQHSVGLASVQPGADLWCRNSVETSGVFQLGCKLGYDGLWCPTLCSSSPNTTNINMYIRSYLPWFGVACCYTGLPAMVWSYPGSLLSQSSPTNDTDMSGDLHHQGVYCRRSLCPLPAVAAHVFGWK